MKTKIGLIFDDGLAKSSLATAKLFEEFGLPAVFAVIAEAKDFAIKFVKGEFALWNELQSRGHLVQPHGYTHVKLTDLPHERAIGELERCLATFGEKLDGFDPKRAVYCYAYNCGNDRMNEWLRPRVRATRQTGSGFLSQRELDAGAWNCETFGPGDPAGELSGLLDRAKRGGRRRFCSRCMGLMARRGGRSRSMVCGVFWSGSSATRCLSIGRWGDDERGLPE